MSIAEPNELVLSPTELVQADVRAQCDIQVATANQFPRSLTDFQRALEEMATLDQDTAASTYYVLKRGGKKIEGPSIRMAEMVAYSWRNIRVEAKVEAIDDKFVTAVATAWDLERNYAARRECKRRITDKNGRRYGDDMIQVTCNAACAIAYREAVFKVVPRSMFKSIYDKAKLASVGGSATIEKKREAAISHFVDMGATEKDVLAFVGCKSTVDITIDHLIDLRGAANRIKEESISWKEALATNEDGPPKGKQRKKSTIMDEPTAKPVGTTSVVGPDPEHKSPDYWATSIEFVDDLKQCHDVAAVDAVILRYKGLCATEEQRENVQKAGEERALELEHADGSLFDKGHEEHP